LKPVDRARWGMSAPTVNAYYSPSGNEIVFPAGIMQLPVFGAPADLPEYVSYGAFGVSQTFNDVNSQILKLMVERCGSRTHSRLR
jgi:hypothetical protein